MDIIVGKGNQQDVLIKTLETAGFVRKTQEPGISWMEAPPWKVVDMDAPERAPDHRTIRVAFVKFVTIKGRTARIYKSFWREQVICRPKTVFKVLDEGGKLAEQRLATQA